MRKEKLEELNAYIKELQLKEIIKTEEDPKFLGIEKNYYRINNGKIIAREKITKEGKEGSAVTILPLTKEKNTILVVQPRVLTKETVGIELPAGYIEEGETAINAARRELEEETGYVPEKMCLLGSYYQDQGCMSAFNSTYLALNCQKLKKQNLDKDEYIRYFECSYEELLELEEMGYIKDINSKYTIEKSKKYIKKRRKKTCLMPKKKQKKLLNLSEITIKKTT